MDKIAEIRQRCMQALAECEKVSLLQELKVRFLGKVGEVTSLLKSIKDPTAQPFGRRFCAASADAFGNGN